MPRPVSQVTHAECQNVVKAAISNGLSISAITLENGKLTVVCNNGESGENKPRPVDGKDSEPLLAEPQT